LSTQALFQQILLQQQQQQKQIEALLQQHQQMNFFSMNTQVPSKPDVYPGSSFMSLGPSSSPSAMSPTLELEQQTQQQLQILKQQHQQQQQFTNMMSGLGVLSSSLNPLIPPLPQNQFQPGLSAAGFNLSSSFLQPGSSSFTKMPIQNAFPSGFNAMASASQPGSSPFAYSSAQSTPSLFNPSLIYPSSLSSSTTTVSSSLPSSSSAAVGQDLAQLMELQRQREMIKAQLNQYNGPGSRPF
jgi:hypothetical protein